MNMKKIRVSIIGATGYTACELVKIFLKHPYIEIAHLAIRQEPFPVFSDLFPQLKGMCDIACSSIDSELICSDSDVIFFALPHKVSMSLMKDFMKSAKKIIDLSADYRFDDKNSYALAYGTEHLDAENLKSFVYGLPEFNSEKIKKAKAIANPGCFPTGVELSLLPVLKEKLIVPDTIIVDSKTGASGGGKTPGPVFHYPEYNENVTAYKVASHQHQFEMEQELSKMAGQSARIVFVPHLIPLTRGIFNTLYADLKTDVSAGSIQELYERYYADKPFVRILKAGAVPQIKHVANTNFCDIGIKTVGQKIILMSAIDNLIKGASGQAVQNMNLMLGIKETMGLI